MLPVRAKIKVADNTGAKVIQCITVFGGYKKRYARLGDIITATVKEAAPHGLVKKGDVIQAVIIRTRKESRRKDGTYIRFDENAAVICDRKTKEPKGTRIFGPVARELKIRGFNQIVSMAAEVL